MIKYKIIKAEQNETNRTAVIEYNEKIYSFDCCGYCPFINYVSDIGDCDLTDEVLKGDIWNEFGEKCPFFKE